MCGVLAIISRETKLELSRESGYVHAFRQGLFVSFFLAVIVALRP
jgi:hypothetical protein